MLTDEDFCLRSYILMIELDAIVTRIMTLVTAGQMNGRAWNEAVTQHRHAIENLQSLMKEIS